MIEKYAKSYALRSKGAASERSSLIPTFMRRRARLVLDGLRLHPGPSVG
jgi:hypothetical protein